MFQLRGQLLHESFLLGVPESGSPRRNRPSSTERDDFNRGAEIGPLCNYRNVSRSVKKRQPSSGACVAVGLAGARTSSAVTITLYLMSGCKGV
ncbi:hypothetical protein D3H35_00250 [Cohnella faecalis]|uniref:Uncharacterized protein n=1 Tax=Cohnella faecalis TaxID=2315694 RepID=A0A398D302_9BACL|nr:hypothetical protein D3H35_00250 [Cohnella faecalis]